MRKRKADRDESVNDPFVNEHGRPNKSALKRELESHQELISQILHIPRSRLDSVELSERILDELALARSMKPGGTLNRQIRLIVKLLEPDELDGLRRVLDRLMQGKAENVALQHKAERLRDRLIAAGSPAPTDVANALDGEEAGSFNRLLLEACSSVSNPHTKHAYRALYKVIYRALEDGSLTLS